MKKQNEHILPLIPDYLEGNLGKEQKKTVETYLENDKDFALELEEYRSLFTAFKNEPRQTPSKKLRQGFLKMLEEEKQHQVNVIDLNPKSVGSNNRIWGILKVAASVALLLSAFLLGQYAEKNTLNHDVLSLEQKNVQLKQTTMIALLENQSASKRIQGVQYIEDFTAPDTTIVNALIDRLLQDENTNVRLSAMIALSGFRDSETVKNAFIRALKTEKDPSIQIAIIQNLVQIQEKRAIKPMQDLLEQEETQPFIKEEITNALPKII